jgi:hypothetical protein
MTRTRQQSADVVIIIALGLAIGAAIIMMMRET